MEIIIASNNQHKAEEMARLFKEHSILLPEKFGIKFNYDEKGTSFLENAMGKAQALYSQIKKPVLSDDSGLCVSALGNKPGIYSSRFGSEKKGKNLTSEERNRLLLSEMKNVDNRKAMFVCCMVLIISNFRFYIVQETFKGEIAHKPEGERGFGYDPIFMLPELGKTVSQIYDYEKDSISHRGKAADKILKLINIS